MAALASSIRLSAPAKASASIRTRSVPAAKPVAAVTLRKQTARMTKVFAAKDLSEEIAKSIEEAKEACEDGTAGECAAAWDTVEEISAEASHQKAKQVKKDPMEAFCEEDPAADECRVYED